MLGIMATYIPEGTDKEDQESHVYLHGSSASRLTRMTADHGDDGLPVCVCATLMDGFVMALAPFHNSCNYRSAVLFGRATKVEDPEEILFAMHAITNEVNPHRWENSRTPPTKAELTATGILKVKIETASCKIRVGGPSDDRKDLKDDELTARVWQGVVPAYLTLGDPLSGPENKVKAIPTYVQNWVDEFNAAGREYSQKATQQ